MADKETFEWVKKFIKLSEEERQTRRDRFIVNLKSCLPKLQAQLEKINGHWEYEDAIYRFYHGSFKVYRLQKTTMEIVGLISLLLPDDLNPLFGGIILAGTGKEFKLAHNDQWSEYTRPILEAFFHAKYFLEMLCKYGQEFDHWPDGPYPSGWAAICSLYSLW